MNMEQEVVMGVPERVNIQCLMTDRKIDKQTDRQTDRYRE